MNSILEPVEHCMCRNHHSNAIHLFRNLETVCCTAWHSHGKVQLCLDVNLKTEQLDEFNGDYDGTVVPKPHSVVLRRKELLNLLVRSRKSFRSVARDMGVEVSYQAGSVWRHSVFLIQDDKGSIFITRHEQDKRPRCKDLEQTQASLLTEHTLVFLKWEKFSARIRCLTLSLVWWVLWHINLCRLFNAKSIFM